MRFQFESLMDFLLMDGHGIYVWAAYLITVLVILFVVAMPFVQKRALLSQIKRQQRIEQGACSGSKV